MKLTFTTTATNRPEIIDTTYSSFCKNLRGVEFDQSTLYINIDPLPNSTNVDKVIDVCKKYFGNVVSNIPDNPNFSAAINWAWSHPTDEFIFHLEDDWVLLNPVHVDSMVAKFSKTIVQVPLRAYKYAYNKLCLSPSLLHHKIYSNVAGRLNTRINPEVQLRNYKITGFRVGAQNISVCGADVIIEDIGRSWLSGVNMSKPSRKNKFVCWERS